MVPGWVVPVCGSLFMKTALIGTGQIAQQHLACSALAS